MAPGFTVSSAAEEEHGEASTTEVGREGSTDPTYASSGSSRPNTADKYARSNDHAHAPHAHSHPHPHPHLAYIYRGRGGGGTAGREDDAGVGYNPSGGGDGKVKVAGGEEKPQEQVTFLDLSPLPQPAG